MPWRRFLAVTVLPLTTTLAGLAQPISSPFKGEPEHILRASSSLQIQRGTLVVTIMETNQIVIAIDSRVTSSRPGKSNSVTDGFQKVVPLSSHMAFFFTGVGMYGTSASTNALVDVAKLITKSKSSQRGVTMEELARDFETRTAAELSSLTTADIYYLHAVAAKHGGSNVFQAFLAGKDHDGAFRVFQIRCDAHVATNGGKLDARLESSVSEVKREGTRWISFYGANKVLADGLNDSTAPLAPFIKQLRTSWSLAEPAAAALLAVAMREYGDGPDSPVGYPLFVHVIDSDGVRLSRKVEKGQSVPFDSRNQGK